MRNRKRVVIFCLMAVMTLFWGACGKGNSDNNPGEGSILKETGGSDKENISNDGAQTSDQNIPEWIYVPERIELADSGADYGGMRLIGDMACYITGNSESGADEKSICQYSLTDQKLKKIPINWRDEGRIHEICCYDFDGDGNVWLVVNAYPAGHCQRFLYKFDAEGNILFCVDASEQLVKRSGYVTGMAVDDQKRIYIFDQQVGIWLYSDDGSYYGDISYGSNREVFDLGTVNLSDGNLLLCVKKGRDAENCVLVKVDFEKRELEEVIKEFPLVRGICAGVAESGYDFLMFDENAAYGYDLAKQNMEELFLWDDSNINGYYACYVSAFPDGRLFCTVEDWWTDDRSIVLLTRRKSEEVPARTWLVLATVDAEDEDLLIGSRAGLVMKMNRNSTRYHITLKKYDSLTSLYNAILAKEPIDLIDLSGMSLHGGTGSGINAENLYRQGVFEDLSPYLEQSAKLSADNLVDGILKVYTFGDTLVGIPDAFTMQTMAGDSGMYGNSAGLTLDGFYEASRNTGGKRLAEGLAGVTKEDMLEYLLLFNEAAFIDWEKGECHFETEQFRKVLELAGLFPDSVELLEDGVPRWQIIDDGEALFAIADLNSIRDFQTYEHIYGENAAFVGFPTPDGRGGTLLMAENAFGITANSAHKAEAWEFIEDFLCRQSLDDVDIQELYMSYTLRFPLKYPARKDILEAMVKFRMEEDRKREETGKGFTNWEPYYHCLNREDVDAILDLIPTAKPWYSREGNVVLQIISEEAGAYYSGQKSLEDVAHIIQNRVQLYVSENS